MQKKIIIKTTDNKNIYGTINIPKEKSKGLIIFMHGLTSSQYEPIITKGSEYFKKKGYTTFTFNFYGEKKHERKLEKTSFKDHINDTNKIIEYFTKKGTKNIFLVGHSFGGLTILYSKISDIIGIILWDSSILGKELLADVGYNKRTKEYTIDRGDGVKYIINKHMYKDFCIPPTKHLEKIKKIKKPIKIICAEPGLNKAGKKYYKNANKPKSINIITGASHCFEEKGTKEKLFNETYQRVKKINI